MVDEVETTNFRFRELTNVKVSQPFLSARESCSLLCVSNKFGLAFIGCNEGVQVFKTSILYAIDKDESLKDKADLSCLKATLLPTPAPPLDVSVSCDGLTLSVCLVEAGKLRCLFFDTRLLSSPTANKTPFCSITLSTQDGVSVSGLHWNPEIRTQLVLCLSNGSLQLLEVDDDVSVVCSDPSRQATAVCWSPKGKQIAVGLKDGHVLQISAKNKAFEEKKRYPPPTDLGSDPVQVSDLFWVSTHSFALMYTPSAGDDKTPSAAFLTTAKDKPHKYLNAGDVFYGGEAKQSKFHFSFLNQWGILVSSSSNAMDTAVFKQAGDVWQLYELEGTGRAAFPLDKKTNDETSAAGMALDLTSQEQVLITEEKSLPPSPLLLLLSDYGVLIPLTVINMECPTSDLRAMVTPPTPLPTNAPRQPKGPQATKAPAAASVAMPKSTIATPTTAIAMPKNTVASVFPNLTGGKLNFPIGGPPGGSLGFPPGGTGAPSVFTGVGQSTGVQGPSVLGGLRVSGPPPAGVLGSMGGPVFGQRPPIFTGPSASSQLLLRGMSPASSLTPTPSAPPPSLLSSGPRPPPYQPSDQQPPPYSYPQQPPPYSSGGQQQVNLQSLAPGIKTPGQPAASTKPTTGVASSQTPLGAPAMGSSTPLPASSRPSLLLSGQQQPRPQGQGGGLTLAAASGGVTGKNLGVGSQPVGVAPGSQGGGLTLAAASGGATGIGVQNLGVGSQPVGVAPGSQGGGLTLAAASGGATGIGVQNLGVGSQPVPSTKPPAFLTPQMTISTQPPTPQLPNFFTMTQSPAFHPKATPTQPPKAVPTHPPKAVPTQPPKAVPTQPPKATPTQPQPPGMISTQPPKAQPPKTTSAQPPAPQPPKAQGIPTRPPQVAAAPRPPPQYVPPTGPPQKPPTQPPVQQQKPPQVPSAKQVPGRSHPRVADSSLSQDRIDSQFASDIQELAGKFAEEIDDLKMAMSEVYGDWEGGRGQPELRGLGKLEDLTRIHEEVTEMRGKVDMGTRQFKKLNQDCEVLVEDTLKVYEILEQTRAEVNKRKDPNYNSLQRLRPLDIESAEVLSQVRGKFLQVQQSLQGVSSQLEGQLEAVYEERRQKGRDPLKVPSLHVVYSTLKDHHRITRLQNVEVERLIQRMKELRLIPRCWEPPDLSASTRRGSSFSPSPSSSSSYSRAADSTPSSCTTPPDRTPARRKRMLATSPSKGAERDTSGVTPQQMTKLREYFGNITTSPVRRVNIAPNVQLSPSEPPSLHGSSTHLSGSPQSDQPDYGAAPSEGIRLAPGIGLSPASSSHQVLLTNGRQQQQQLQPRPVVPSQQHPPPAAALSSRQLPKSVLLSSDSQSSISTLQSDGEPDVTLTEEGVVVVSKPHLQPQRSSKYDVLISPDRKIAVNLPTGQQQMFSIDSVTASAQSQAPSAGGGGGGGARPHPSTMAPGGSGGLGTIHYRPQQPSIVSQVTQAPGVSRGPGVGLGLTPMFGGIQLPPPGQGGSGHPPIPSSKLNLQHKPSPSIYPSHNSEGATILHGSLPQLSTLQPSASGAGQGLGELRKTLGHNNLSLIAPGGGGGGGGGRGGGGVGGDGFGLLSGTSSASVPNVNSADSAETSGVGSVSVSRLPTTTTTSTGPASTSAQSAGVPQLGAPVTSPGKTSTKLEHLLRAPIDTSSVAGTSTSVAITSSGPPGYTLGGPGSTGLLGTQVPNLFKAPAATATSGPPGRLATQVPNLFKAPPSTTTSGPLGSGVFFGGLVPSDLFKAPSATTTSGPPALTTTTSGGPLTVTTPSLFAAPPNKSVFSLSLPGGFPFTLPPASTATASCTAKPSTVAATPPPFTFGGLPTGSPFSFNIGRTSAAATAQATTPAPGATSVSTSTSATVVTTSKGPGSKPSSGPASGGPSLDGLPKPSFEGLLKPKPNLEGPPTLNLGGLPKSGLLKPGPPVRLGGDSGKTSTGPPTLNLGGLPKSELLKPGPPVSLGGESGKTSTKDVPPNVTVRTLKTSLSVPSTSAGSTAGDGRGVGGASKDTPTAGGTEEDDGYEDDATGSVSSSEDLKKSDVPSDAKDSESPDGVVPATTSAASLPPKTSAPSNAPLISNPPVSEATSVSAVPLTAASSETTPPPPTTTSATGAPSTSTETTPPPPSTTTAAPSTPTAAPPPPPSTPATAPPPPPSTPATAPPPSTPATAPPPLTSTAAPPPSTSTAAPPPPPPTTSAEAPPTLAPPTTAATTTTTASVGVPPITTSSSAPPPAPLPSSLSTLSSQPSALQSPAPSGATTTAVLATGGANVLSGQQPGGSGPAVEESEMGDDMDFVACEPSTGGTGGSGPLNLGGMGLGGQATVTSPTANPFGGAFGTPSRQSGGPTGSGGLFRQSALGTISPQTGLSSSTTPQSGGLFSGGQGASGGSGFGASPSFGSPSVFGARPTQLGGGSAFGGSPVFGSGGGPAGGVTNAPLFGSGGGNRGGGESLSFGNLAQNQGGGFGGPPAGGMGVGNSSMSGSSFSGWR